MNIGPFLTLFLTISQTISDSYLGPTPLWTRCEKEIEQKQLNIFK